MKRDVRQSMRITLRAWVLAWFACAPCYAATVAAPAAPTPAVVDTRPSANIVMTGVNASQGAPNAQPGDHQEAPPVSVPQVSYSVEASKGRLIHLSSAASAVIAADPTIADVQVISPSMIYLSGKSVGETTVLAVDSRDNEILRAVVSVTNNISLLNSAVKSMLPGSNVSFQSIDGALVMKGDVESPMQAEDVRRLAAPFVKEKQTLINMLHPLGSNQVMLKVKVAEVDRTELKTFGIRLEGMGNIQGFVMGAATGQTVIDTGTGLITRNGTTDTLSGKYNNNIGVIDALEDNGLVTTLAEPTLTTQSGQPASFLAGGEFPVPAVTGSGSSQQVSITYQPYGVSLSFTPVILSRDRINLTVVPEVSELSQTGAVEDAGFNIPALTTRKASTTVELGSGQSFAIAGLLESDRNNDITKFPFLGDIPILGTLFRSSQFQNNQTELVIIVTPYIVGPVDQAKALRDPTQGLVMPNEAERILMGKLYKEQPPAADDSSGIRVTDTPRLNGPVGYVLK